MNITGKEVESLFSVGVEESGKVSDYLHETKFNLSDGLNHAAAFLNIMKDEAQLNSPDDNRDMIQQTLYLLHM